MDELNRLQTPLVPSHRVIENDQLFPDIDLDEDPVRVVLVDGNEDLVQVEKVLFRPFEHAEGLSPVLGLA